jgi:transcription antitermination factor NusG
MAEAEGVCVEPSIQSEAGWWAIYTRHQHEKVIAQTLFSKGFEVFLPLYAALRRWKDRSKTLSLPLFPCYVFIRGSLDRRLHVLTTPGIYTVLTRGGEVAMIPDDEIQAVRRAVDGTRQVEPHPFLKCGERVRVVHGSLEGVEGILVRKKNLFRLVISVELLARSASVEIDACDVEPVRPPKPGFTARPQPRPAPAPPAYLLSGPGSGL